VSDDSPAVAVLGFGELGQALVRTVRASGDVVPRVWARPQPAPEADAWQQEVRDVGGVPVPALDEALAGAALVLCCVPATGSMSTARQVAGHLAPGAVYADLGTAAPEIKQHCARVVEATGAWYADVAVLGAAVSLGGAMPMLASGDGAPAFAATGPTLGLAVTAMDGPPGAAARVKLLRSVYLKGRDALVAEMAQGARHYGLEDVVVASIRGPGEEVAFPQLAGRILTSLDRHAARRADELAASAQLLRAGGVEPAATEGAERRLRLVADDAD